MQTIWCSGKRENTEGNWAQKDREKNKKNPLDKKGTERKEKDKPAKSSDRKERRNCKMQKRELMTKSVGRQGIR